MNEETKKSTIVSEAANAELKKSILNLVIIGHVDAGKSTMLGHLLYLLGNVSDKTMHKYKQEAERIGKGSFAFAWVLDETQTERSRGVTVDIAQTTFETENKIVNLMDAPGHKDFIPNMIRGASAADCAMLVVDSGVGEFETGFESGGQTREHLILARSLGVSYVIVAVNKMDKCDWSKQRYDEITQKLEIFLKQLGFKDKDFIFVPCSGLLGQNLRTKPSVGEWYTGDTLFEVIDKVPLFDKSINKPLRFYVDDILKSQSTNFLLSGNVDTGKIKVGEKVIIMPSRHIGHVKTITIDDKTETFANAGYSISLQLTTTEAVDIKPGDFICDIKSPPIKVTNKFKARVLIFNVEIPITQGFQVMLHYKAITVEALIKNLISQLNKTGEVVKARPRFLTKNMNAIVEIELQEYICIELYEEFKELGRILLRYAGNTIAAGFVIEIDEKNQ